MSLLNRLITIMTIIWQLIAVYRDVSSTRRNGRIKDAEPFSALTCLKYHPVHALCCKLLQVSARGNMFTLLVDIAWM